MPVKHDWHTISAANFFMYHYLILLDLCGVALFSVVHWKHILPGVPVCSSGNICGHQEWCMSEQMPCEPSSGASLLWTKESRQVENKFNQRIRHLFSVPHKRIAAFLPVKGWSSTRLQPLLLSKTLYLVTAEWACRCERTLVTPSPASFILKRGLRAI